MVSTSECRFNVLATVPLLKHVLLWLSGFLAASYACNTSSCCDQARACQSIIITLARHQRLLRRPHVLTLVHLLSWCRPVLTTDQTSCWCPRPCPEYLCFQAATEPLVPRAPVSQDTPASLFEAADSGHRVRPSGDENRRAVLQWSEERPALHVRGKAPLGRQPLAQIHVGGTSQQPRRQQQQGQRHTQTQQQGRLLQKLQQQQRQQVQKQGQKQVQQKLQHTQVQQSVREFSQSHRLQPNQKQDSSQALATQALPSPLAPNAELTAEGGGEEGRTEQGVVPQDCLNDGQRMAVHQCDIYSCPRTSLQSHTVTNLVPSCIPVYDPRPTASASTA